MQIVALDVFCGAGGVTFGLRKSGIKVAVGVDRNEDCRFTYTQNNPASQFIREDIRKLSAKTLMSYAGGLSPDDFLLLTACAPCQPFSSQNRYRNNGDDRAVLRHVERLVRELRPDFLFIENVPGLRKVGGFSAFRRLRSALKSLHYKVRFDVVDAAWHGVPQHRNRLVLTASQYGAAPWAEQSHGNKPDMARYVTVRDVIAGYPPIEAGQAHATVPNHMTAQIASQNLDRLKATRPDGGSRGEWSSELVLECHKTHDGHPDVYGRLRWDAPAPTLTTKCTSISNGRYGHPEQHRAISVREAAALQGFDDSYVFYGGIRELTRQIGNAVPPILAEKFGAAFVTHALEINGSKKKLPWHKFTQKNGAALSNGRPSH